jgi:hypothetical protein
MSAETGNRLTEKANAAFRQAAAKVVERARQTGTPVIVWENGQVAEHSAEELEGPDSLGSQTPGGTRKNKGQRSK